MKLLFWRQVWSEIFCEFLHTLLQNWSLVLLKQNVTLMNCVANHKIGVSENSQLTYISGTKLLKNTPSKKAPKTEIHSKTLRKTAFQRSKSETSSSSCSFCLQQPLKTPKRNQFFLRLFILFFITLKDFISHFVTLKVLSSWTHS